MFIIENYAKKSYESNSDYMSNALNNLTTIVEHYFEDKPSFSSNDYELYYFDENIMQTQANKTKKYTIYLELNPTSNIKIHQRKTRKRDINVFDMYLPLNSIREDLRDLFVSAFDSSVMIGLTERSIMLREVSKNQNNEDAETFIEVIPCFKHLDKEDNLCVVYYNKSKKNIVIKHTKKIIEQFNSKNKETNGLYSKYILVFKNVFKEHQLVNDLPSEIVETLLYNVPNSIYTELSEPNLIAIINFLRNKNLTEYKTIDEQQLAFTSKYSTLSYLYARNFLKQLEKAIKKLI